MRGHAWDIIRGLCKGIGWGFFIYLSNARDNPIGIMKVGSVAILGVLFALLIGYTLFRDE